MLRWCHQNAVDLSGSWPIRIGYWNYPSKIQHLSVEYLSWNRWSLIIAVINYHLTLEST
jgi:hypothetical protein